MRTHNSGVTPSPPRLHEAGQADARTTDLGGQGTSPGARAGDGAQRGARRHRATVDCNRN